MWHKFTITILALAIAQLICTTNPQLVIQAHCEDFCESLYIVTPPGNNGGTIYLSEEEHAYRETLYHPRAGYLPVGTFLFLDNPRIAVGIRNSDRSSVAPYYRFTAITGATGFVSANSVSSFKKLLSRPENIVSCSEVDSIIVPMDPGDDVTVYTQALDTDTPLGDRQTRTFSRSQFAPFFIVKGDKRVVDVGLDKQPAYQVTYFELQSNKWITRKGFLPRDKEDSPGISGTYSVAEVPKDMSFFTPCTKKSQTWLNDIWNRAQYLFSVKKDSKDSNNLINIFRGIIGKKCGTKFEERFSASLATPKLGLFFSSEIEGEYSISIDSNILYRDLYYVTGCNSHTIFIAETLECYDTFPSRVRRMQIVIRDEPHIHRIIDSDEVLELGKGVFFTPVPRPGHREDAMFVIAYNKTERDYFTAFRELNRHLDSVIFGDDEVSYSERQQILGLLTSLMSDWYGVRDRLPARNADQDRR